MLVRYYCRTFRVKLKFIFNFVAYKTVGKAASWFKAPGNMTYCVRVNRKLTPKLVVAVGKACEVNGLLISLS